MAPVGTVLITTVTLATTSDLHRRALEPPSCEIIRHRCMSAFLTPTVFRRDRVRLCWNSNKRDGVDCRAMHRRYNTPLDISVNVARAWENWQCWKLSSGYNARWCADITLEGGMDSRDDFHRRVSHALGKDVQCNYNQACDDRNEVWDLGRWDVFNRTWY